MADQSKPADFSIRPIATSQDLADAIQLFHAYAESLGIDLGFQDFATEMASMPGKYSPPTGALLLAHDQSGKAIGCVALRQLKNHGVCEMKRLYVDAAGRGTGVGKALAHASVVEARLLGYRAMRLDTLPSMASARSLYMGMGFKEIEAYYDTPLAGTIFLELDLDNT